ncbi:MAG: lipoyl(octanoyl) transferase LipB [Alphaproteobacteria bacterium]|nr:lipoyl(octanoyl) transferase LipB [Alphaproteobacteria bacterium]
MAEWHVSSELIPYEEAIDFMERRVQGILEGTDEELVWLLEHPSLYTAGTSAKKSDLLVENGLPLYISGRGGQYTYHGPGQRIAYVMIDLTKRNRDVRTFVTNLEQWVIDTLSEFGIVGERRIGRVGVWVNHQGKDQKIAALGIRLRKWISFHGIAINVNPNLSYFKGIVPCGLPHSEVTSCKALNIPISLSDLDKALQRTWEKSSYW